METAQKIRKAYYDNIHRNILVDQQIASNPETPVDVLENFTDYILSECPFADDIDFLVYSHGNLPTECRLNLFSYGSFQLKRKINGVYKKNPFSETDIQKLIDNENTQVRWSAASLPNLTMKQTKQLLNDKSSLVIAHMISFQGWTSFNVSEELVHHALSEDETFVLAKQKALGILLSERGPTKTNLNFFFNEEAPLDLLLRIAGLELYRFNNNVYNNSFLIELAQTTLFTTRFEEFSEYFLKNFDINLLDLSLDWIVKSLSWSHFKMLDLQVRFLGAKKRYAR